jgi:hypothetical protein
MRKAMSILSLTIIVAMSLLVSAPAEAARRGLAAGPSHWLSCENGGSYPIRPLAVSYDGDIVTGYLGMRQNRGIYVRLIPMGAGYRYAGRGVWFDGAQESVYLYFSKNRPIACTLVQGPDRARG